MILFFLHTRIRCSEKCDSSFQRKNTFQLYGICSKQYFANSDPQFEMDVFNRMRNYVCRIHILLRITHAWPFHVLIQRSISNTVYIFFTVIYF